jgi:hypothetical protein
MPMIHRRTKLLMLAAACGVLLSATPARADVQLTIRDGRVTLRATNATVREILAEWGRIGQARIVNGDRLTGAPITIELTNVTEGQALDVLLRTVAGYMAAPRATVTPNASQFDRIMILPTSTPPRVAATPPPPSFPQPQFTQPPQQVDDDDDLRPPAPTQRPQQGPVFNTFPPPITQPFNPLPPRGNAPANPATPGVQMPVGVSVPGMIVQPPPPQPGQPIVPPQ